MRCTPPTTAAAWPPKPPTQYCVWDSRNFELHRICANVINGNAASVKLLTRLGMRQEGHLVENVFFKGEWCDELVFALRAREWRDR